VSCQNHFQIHGVTVWTSHVRHTHDRYMVLSVFRHIRCIWSINGNTLHASASFIIIHHVPGFIDKIASISINNFQRQHHAYLTSDSGFRLSIHAFVPKIQPDKIVWWCQNSNFCVLYFQRAACSTSDVHSKFALRPHDVWKYGRHPISDRWG